jgi:hypothetical protein
LAEDVVVDEVEEEAGEEAGEEVEVEEEEEEGDAEEVLRFLLFHIVTQEFILVEVNRMCCVLRI